MHSLTANILYREIREMNPEGGLYIWATPNERGVLRLQAMLDDAPFDAENSTEYHTTILYHLGSLPESALMPSDYPCTAVITEIVSWTDKHGTETVVALLDSPDLQEIHASLLKQGLTHTFSEYRPHVTLGTKVEANPALRLWLDGLNDEIKGSGIPIGFDACIKGSLNEDD